jgi:hypothetical protein
MILMVKIVNNMVSCNPEILLNSFFFSNQWMKILDVLKWLNKYLTSSHWLVELSFGNAAICGIKILKRQIFNDFELINRWESLPE